VKRKILYFLVVVLRFLTFFIPFRLGQKIGSFLGYLSYFVVKKYRNTAIENIKTCFPEMKDSEVCSLTKRVFINQGKNFFEVLMFHRLNKKNVEKIVSFEGRSNLEKAFSFNKGVLILAAHFGNWELLGASLSIFGFPINVIARRVYIEGLERIITKIRMSKGMKVITRGERDSSYGIVRALHKNQAIGILIDQNTKSVPGVYVNFFGKKAYTPSGLAVLAIKTGAVVVPGFIIRQKNDTHRIEISEPVEIIKTGDISKDIEKNTQIFNDIIESYVRKYPEQWVWFHKRWD